MEYREHLVRDYGEKIVKEFDDNYRKVNPVRNWQEVIEIFDSL